MSAQRAPAIVGALALVFAHGAQAQSTSVHTKVGMEYGIQMLRVVDSAGLIVTEPACALNGDQRKDNANGACVPDGRRTRTMDAVSRPVIYAAVPWTLFAELEAPVPSGLDAMIVTSNGVRVRVSATGPSAAVASSAQRCDRCVMQFLWQFRAAGATPAALPPRVRFVIEAGVTPIRGSQ